MAANRVHKLARRLDASVIARLVAEYEAGVPTTRLTERYVLGKGTVLSVLRQHGVKVRRQGLTKEEVTTAVELYTDGQSLAKIGQRFGCAHTVVRKALLDAGIATRPRQGWNY